MRGGKEEEEGEEGRTSRRTLNIRILDHNIRKHLRRVKQLEPLRPANEFVRRPSPARVLEAEDDVDGGAEAVVGDEGGEVAARQPRGESQQKGRTGREGRREGRTASPAAT